MNKYEAIDNISRALLTGEEPRAIFDAPVYKEEREALRREFEREVEAEIQKDTEIIEDSGGATILVVCPYCNGEVEVDKESGEWVR